MAEAEPKKEKKAYGLGLFADRMRREGRGEEWYKKLRAERERLGKGHATEAMRIVAKEMGYLNPGCERTKLKLLQEAMGVVNRKEEVRREGQEIAEKIVAEVQGQLPAVFTEAVKTLPNVVSGLVELEWVSCHPAICRRSRQPDEMKKVLIAVEDILEPPNGRAPSARAVYQLQHWVNYPREFHKAILDVQKKQSGESGGDKGETGKDMDLAEVERLLKQVKGDSEAE